MGVQLDKRVRHKITREKGHFYVDILMVCEGSADDAFISFLYDTGAWMTVLSRRHYEANNLNTLPRQRFSMGGYGAGEDNSRKIPGYVYKIPALKIGNKLLAEVWAFTPASYDITENILGGNAIEYFCPFQDNNTDFFYFFDNPSPKPYKHEPSGLSLECGGVFPLND